MIWWVELREIVWEDSWKGVLLCVILEYPMIWTYFSFCVWVWIYTWLVFSTQCWTKEKVGMPSHRVRHSVVSSECFRGARRYSSHWAWIIEQHRRRSLHLWSSHSEGRGGKTDVINKQIFQYVRRNICYGKKEKSRANQGGMAFQEIEIALPFK